MQQLQSENDRLKAENDRLKSGKAELPNGMYNVDTLKALQELFKQIAAEQGGTPEQQKKRLGLIGTLSQIILSMITQVIDTLIPEVGLSKDESGTEGGATEGSEKVDENRESHLKGIKFSLGERAQSVKDSFQAIKLDHSASVDSFIGNLHSLKADALDFFTRPFVNSMKASQASATSRRESAQSKRATSAKLRGGSQSGDVLQKAA